jgi:hypothetical protein
MPDADAEGGELECMLMNRSAFDRLAICVLSPFFSSNLASRRQIAIVKNFLAIHPIGQLSLRLRLRVQHPEQLSLIFSGNALSLEIVVECDIYRPTNQYSTCRIA